MDCVVRAWVRALPVRLRVRTRNMVPNCMHTTRHVAVSVMSIDILGDLVRIEFDVRAERRNERASERSPVCGGAPAMAPAALCRACRQNTSHPGAELTPL